MNVRRPLFYSSVILNSTEITIQGIAAAHSFYSSVILNSTEIDAVRVIAPI